MRTVDDLGGCLDGGAMLLQMAAAEGVSGVIALGPSLVAAIIQQQTYGALVSLDGSDRRYTETDAALCVPFVEAVLARAVELADRDADRATLDGHHFVARASDVASVVIALEADRFRVFDLTIDIAEGTAQTRLTVLLRDCPAASKAPDEGAGARRRIATLDQVALNASVRLNAVLCRVPLMLSEMSGLRVGDLLPLPAYRIDQTELLTMSGGRIGHGRLGRVEGLRAVRVNETTAPDTVFTGEMSTSRAPDMAQSTVLDQPDLPPIEAPGEDDDFALDQLDHDEAIKRISQLAGLDESMQDGGGTEGTPV